MHQLLDSFCFVKIGIQINKIGNTKIIRHIILIQYSTDVGQEKQRVNKYKLSIYINKIHFFLFKLTSNLHHTFWVVSCLFVFVLSSKKKRSSFFKLIYFPYMNQQHHHHHSTLTVHDAELSWVVMMDQCNR